MDIRSDDVLLVIDVQNDFCPGGALAVDEGDRVVPIINRLADRFGHVILTQDWHPPGHASFASSHPGKAPFDTVDMAYGSQILWPDHCVQGTDGAAFHPDLATDRAEMIVRKGFRADVDSYSALFENDQTTPTGLRAALRERGFGRVFIAGLAYDVCVRFSAEDCARAGLDTVVIGDACRAVGQPGAVDATRESFGALGIVELASEEIAAAA